MRRLSCKWFRVALLWTAFLVALCSEPSRAKGMQVAQKSVSGTLLSVSVRTGGFRVPTSSGFLLWNESDAPVIASASLHGVIRRTWAIPTFGAPIGKSMRLVSYDTKSQFLGKSDVLTAKYVWRPIEIGSAGHTTIQDFSIPFGQGLDDKTYVVFLRLTVSKDVAFVSFRHPNKPGLDIATSR